MPSFTDPPARRRAEALRTGNRRVHAYAGLFLLFYLWLFALTGLLLNHPRWSFAEFWPQRSETTTTHAIQPPPPGGDLAQARDIMRQLDIHGEIDWTQAPVKASQLEFRVSRPGHIFSIRADFDNGSAKVQRIGLNAWGTARILHSFTGVRLADMRNERDWTPTTLWALSMDALALGLAVMVLSSLYLWWSQPRERAAGSLALGLGVLACGFFVAGLRLFF